MTYQFLPARVSVTAALLSALVFCSSEPPPLLPSQLSNEDFYNYIAPLTVTQFYGAPDRESTLTHLECETIASHTVRAALGATVLDDIRNGAAAVDNAVRRDDGNAYNIDDFGWFALDSRMSQLVIEITSMRCEE